MINSTFFFAGVYGVGKTTLCDKIAALINVPSYSASQLITEGIGEKYDANKVVTDKVKNQYSLVEELNKKFQISNEIILAGHFCIFNKNNSVEEIPEFVFTKLHIRAIILLEADLSNIINNIADRDRKLYPIEAIDELIYYERSYAIRISEILKIPIFIHKMSFRDSDVRLILDFIASIRG